MTAKESERARGTHILKSAKRQVRDSGQREEDIDRESLTSWRAERHAQVRAVEEGNLARGTRFLESGRDGQVKTAQKARELIALTSWRAQREGQVRAAKERGRERRSTHILEGIE
jgi:hypothetical protein